MIDVGQIAPPFALHAQDGKLVSLADLQAKGPVVVFFYPKDETSGCTAEACAFRDQYADFTDLGASVVGISSDSVQSHQKFVSKHQFQYSLLSDPGEIVRKAYGVSKAFGIIPGRVTFVIDSDGVVRSTFSSLLMATKHIPAALQTLKHIKDDKS